MWQHNGIMRDHACIFSASIKIIGLGPTQKSSRLRGPAHRLSITMHIPGRFLPIVSSLVSQPP